MGDLADARRAERPVPGYEGSVGPGPGQYGQPHVYARDVTSGAGNCVCGRALGNSGGIHTEAAPGVPIPGLGRPAGPRRSAAEVGGGPAWSGGLTP